MQIEKSRFSFSVTPQGEIQKDVVIWVGYVTLQQQQQ